jgi:predicted nucleic acid-binding protein
VGAAYTWSLPRRSPGVTAAAASRPEKRGARNLPRRHEVLSLLGELPGAMVASDEEALELIERHRLMGQGIGYVDVHLLAAALLTGDVPLWTLDARLAAAASSLAVGYAEGCG